VLIFRLHKLGIEAHAYAHYTSVLCFALAPLLVNTVVYRLRCPVIQHLCTLFNNYELRDCFKVNSFDYIIPFYYYCKPFCKHCHIFVTWREYECLKWRQPKWRHQKGDISSSISSKGLQAPNLLHGKNCLQCGFYGAPLVPLQKIFFYLVATR